MTTTQLPDIVSLLDTASPVLSMPQVGEIARDVFGLTAAVSELAGERDRNFHLRVGETHYVLKVSNPAEDRQVIDFQTGALLHIASVDPGLPVPRVIPTRSGAAEWLLTCAGQEPRVIRVLSFLQGEPLYRVPTSAMLRRNLGRDAARLDLALRGFFHPAAGHELMWDLKHAIRVRDLLVHIQDREQRALAERFLDNFETNALPVLPRLRAQVIHNDLNPHNVLVSTSEHSRIAGIIDFGDMVHAPLVNNLAVAAAYQLASTGHPLEAMADLIAAYHSVLPLEPIELEILFDLIATRMVLTVAITGWRAARHPENEAYILRNNPQAWAGLERFDSLTRTDAQAYLRQACHAE
ncbi:phosphotransferase [Microvirga brassicacearum]|nr:phosphotransferase [Microvirga brassicacearum]